MRRKKFLKQFGNFIASLLLIISLILPSQVYGLEKQEDIFDSEISDEVDKKLESDVEETPETDLQNEDTELQEDGIETEKNDLLDEKIENQTIESADTILTTEQLGVGSSWEGVYAENEMETTYTYIAEEDGIYEVVLENSVYRVDRHIKIIDSKNRELMNDASFNKTLTNFCSMRQGECYSVVVWGKERCGYSLSVSKTDANEADFFDISNGVLTKYNDTYGSPSNVRIPEGVSRISSTAFVRGSINIYSITFPKSVSYIDTYPGRTQFMGFSSPGKYYYVEEGNNAYSSVDGVLYDYLEETLIWFPGRRTGKFYMKDNASRIGEYAFCGSIIENVELSSNIKEIGRYSFWYCDDLLSVSLPDSLKVINDSAFSNCTSLLSIDFPEQLEEIGSAAFYRCEKIEKVIIPSSIQEISSSTFSQCSLLESIDVESGNSSYCSIDGVLYERWYNEVELLCVPSGKKGTYSIPENTDIGSALSGSVSASISGPEITMFSSLNLTGVVFPKKFSYSSSLFVGSPYLREISVVEGSEWLQSRDGILFSKNDDKTYTLRQYPVLKSGSSYTVPSDVSVIASNAFKCVNYYGRVLKSITIPKSVTDIETEAFVDYGKGTLEIRGYNNSAAHAYYKENAASQNLTWTSLGNAQDAYTVSFNGNGGSVSTKSKEVTVGKTYGTLPKPTKSGSAFQGWYTKKTGGTQITSSTNVSLSKNHTLYAHWGKPISDTKITLSTTSYTYSGSAKKPSVTVKAGSTKLKSGTDYKVTYSNNTNAGTASVKISGIGKYGGSKTVKFTINKKSITSMTTSIPQAEYTYTKSKIQPIVTVKNGSKKLTLNTDYTVSYTKNVNVGTATITTKGKGNYNGTLTKTFKIKAKSIKALDYNQLQSYTYDGVAKKPILLMYYKSTVLVKDTDFTIKYKNNTNAGTATMEVTGKGNYSEGRTFTFPIRKATQTISATTEVVKGYSAIGTKTGLNVSGIKGGAKVTYSSNDTKVATVSSNGAVTIKGAGQAKITIKAAATTNYNGASKAVTIIVKPKQVSISSIAIKENTITVKWGKVTNASGYEVSYKTGNSAYKKINVSGTSLTIKDLKAVTSYTIRVRAYLEKNGTKYYGGYSATKEVKTDTITPQLSVPSEITVALGSTYDLAGNITYSGNG